MPPEALNTELHASFKEGTKDCYMCCTMSIAVLIKDWQVCVSRPYEYCAFSQRMPDIFFNLCFATYTSVFVF